MKFSKLIIALGFFALLGSSCSHHSSCPAYNSQNVDEVETESVMTIEESNV